MSMPPSSISIAFTGHTSWQALQELFSYLQARQGMVLARGFSL